MSSILQQINSLRCLKESNLPHLSPYLSGRSIPSLLGSFISNGHLFPQKRQDHQKKGTLLARRQLLERSTIFSSFQHNLRILSIGRLLALLSVVCVSLFTKSLCLIIFLDQLFFRAIWHDTFCMHILFIFLAQFEHLNNKHITKIQQNICWDIIAGNSTM